MRSHAYGLMRTAVALCGSWRAGLPWEQLFYISAAIAVGIGLVLLYTLKPSPVSIGEPEPQSNVRNVYAKEGRRAHAPHARCRPHRSRTAEPPARRHVGPLR